LKGLDEVTITADTLGGDFIIGVKAEVLFLIKGVNGAGDFGKAGFEEGFEPLAGELHEVGDCRFQVGVFFDLLRLDLEGDLLDGDDVEFVHGGLGIRKLENWFMVPYPITLGRACR